ncbi:hypothetical protein IAQ61_004369 [Plenodomus lingam]|uniref:Uncharacterized protein n=1 Tax=Leptosphaeria maculans (strain JN3 / isolate v23.1.3 / race Av1-4-5-6-7-8) TaxID=985895 RepID=E4ZVB2_LEPMJ|nr:hypothetical protein LEMA_P026900.1 [Plenodomus lingam JN3]KAH9873742.1 hypothetical protein IAQ61_004369 [Plenodomus lingam]CBX95538.1 hypothetical protein LEMA_P026900.1 [Plenodomus lingam JN3]
MGIKRNILFASALAFSVFAAPVPDCSEEQGNSTNKALLSAAKIEIIEPTTATCDAAPFPEECADSKTAAAALNGSFEKYKITAVGEVAALVAYTLFESGNYKYKQNHYPGRPGQGTRMMAMPNYVNEYTTTVAGADAVAQAEAAGGDAGLVAVLALANADDQKSFGSAAWYLTTKCTPKVRAGLVAETVDGWHNFLTQCIGTTAAAERDPAWIAAKQALSQ